MGSMNDFAKKCIYKPSAFRKEDVRQFTEMIDEMMNKYSSNRDYVIDSIGVSEKEINNLKFSCYQFKSTLNFYLREKANDN
jgi:hypothetical protein